MSRFKIHYLTGGDSVLAPSGRRVFPVTCGGHVLRHACTEHPENVTCLNCRRKMDAALRRL